MMEHYSERLARHFEDDDWLYYPEVLSVLAANSGRSSVPRTNVGSLVDAGVLHPRKLPGSKANINQYQYSEVKDLVVAQGRGRRAKHADTPGAIRTRRFRERRRASGQKKMEASLIG